MGRVALSVVVHLGLRAARDDGLDEDLDVEASDVGLVVVVEHRCAHRLGACA